MTVLKQSTQIKVRIGPFVAVGDGFTPVTTVGNTPTNLTGVDEAELLKADGAATVDLTSATWAAITGADGWYDLTLTTSHTDTIGELVVVVQDDSLCLPVFARFQVVEEAVYVAMFASGATGVPAALSTLIGTPVTDLAADIAAVLADTDLIDDGTSGLAKIATDVAAVLLDTGTDGVVVASIAANAVNASAIADGAIDAGAIAASALDGKGDWNTTTPPTAAAIADAVFDEPRGDHATQGTYGETFNTVISGTVDDTAFTPTPTEFEASDITEATTDHYKGRIVLFTTGALAGQGALISAYSLSGGRGHFTVPAMTDAALTTHEFIIV